MGTWTVTSALEDKEPEELIELRNRALDYLVNNQLDAVGCAEHLNISFLEFISLRDAFKDDFDNSRLALISDCEALIAGVAQGTVGKIEPARVAAAKYVLDRQSPDWIPKKATKEEKEKVPPANGQGQAILNRFIEEKDGKPKVSIN